MQPSGPRFASVILQEWEDDKEPEGKEYEVVQFYF